MSTPVLATKLYIPPPRPKVIHRPRLVERLNEGLHRKLTLISAPAGFGKTTLVSEWVAGCDRQVAWLSLDEGDNDPARFITYFVVALQKIVPGIGASVLAMHQSPQPPPPETVLTALLNEITTIQENFLLVLDDYHVIDATPVDQALTFLIEHLPPQMHLVIATREDPQLPLARLRARGQLSELRVMDLRFTPSEAAGFLHGMGLDLSAEDVTALETRTEGWIAGLQLAAISLQGHQAPTSFIKSFTGSHHFVMDYLVEEVLQQQPESVQAFLLRTSILDRLCGPLCEAVLLDAAASGQVTLEYLERSNLFIIPLDDERRWYRYHHLFADLLRQRLHQSVASSTGDGSKRVAELHIRASQWYEDNGLDIEAFQHAAAANDIPRAERLVDGKGIPLHFRGAVTTILGWLESLPPAVKNARPSLWWRHGALLLVGGQTTGVEEKLQAAEDALQGTEVGEDTQYLVGQIAAARATLAITRYDVETLLTQSHRALEYLHPKHLTLRANAYWTLGFAYLLQGDRAAARQALSESISLSQASRSVFTNILATIGLGQVQEADNQLYQAAETYRRVLQVAGDQPLQIIAEAHLGLARVLYEWNDLEAAEQHGQQSLYLARQYDKVIDRFIIGEVFLARLKLAHADVDGAVAMLAQTAQTAREKNFVHRIPEVAAAQVVALLRQGKVAEAAHIAQAHNLPVGMARVHLAQGDASAALAVLEPLRREVEAKAWEDERLKVMLLQAVALRAQGEKDEALQLLGEAMSMSEPGGFIRIFVDEGAPMAQLLAEAITRGIMSAYASRLLAAFEPEKPGSAGQSPLHLVPRPQPLVEPLSQRELEVLQLIAQGLSNRDISERLFLALDTVKGHNRKIFDKLQVQSRTEAIARARELGLL
ncbi:MAG: LuxR C-terminal-related transcriptional regulator [Chloroflexota bacterium]|nr:LuxR C-terminal-related transcriptional regulator [Chloroflexota bacterium]